MKEEIYEYKGDFYPYYLKDGNATQYIQAFAEKLCTGKGLDIGSGEWPLERVTQSIDNGDFNAYNLPDKDYDYIYSSHCLEHLDDPVKALEIWRDALKVRGKLFLYLPHPDMEYWLPQNNRKHKHFWWPEDMEKLLSDLNFVNIIRSQRDLFWSYAIIGYKV